MTEQEAHAERSVVRRRRARARRRLDGGLRAPVLPDDFHEPFDGAPALDVTEVEDVLQDLDLTEARHE